MRDERKLQFHRSTALLQGWPLDCPWSFFHFPLPCCSSRELLTPNPIGAKAGRSTAPDSATCNKSISFDCFYGGRSNTTTPSARSAGPNRPLFTRKSTPSNPPPIPH